MRCGSRSKTSRQHVSSRREQLEQGSFREEPIRIIAEGGGRPQLAVRCLLALPRPAPTGLRFISAASFQETPRVLPKRLVAGQVDYLPLGLTWTKT